ncbi:MAG: T9SS type A sorting domain-containing protein [Bacteroidota bacterium]|nr:T9SS type A sorting domain-containing protein [Bacteroidota bacterium]
MKKIYSLATLVFIGFAAHAQTFWTEDFGTGCNRGQDASAYTGTNGAWTMSSTGTNDNTANTWYVSASHSNTGAGNCASSCMTTSATNATLHVSNVAIVIPSFYNVAPDSGASYFSGGVCSFGYCAITNRRAQSPLINCTGESNITISFLYVENGDASNDDASFVFSADGGTTWSTVNALAKTTGTCAAPGQWTSVSFALPATANNNANVKIGFNWTNNDDGVGTDPSFSVDDITLTSGTSGIATAQAAELNLFASGNGQITITPNGQTYKMVGIYNMLGQDVKFINSNNTLHLSDAQQGIYIVTLEVNGVRVTRKVLVN